MKERCDLDFDKDREEVGKKQHEPIKAIDVPNETTNSNNTQVCHTMSTKKCETTYRPQMTKVKVRVCPNSIDLDNESKRKMENR